MSTEISSTCDAPVAKKPKIMEDDEKKELTPFKDFRLVKVLSDNSQRKMVCVHGRFGESSDDAVVILEKTPFSDEIMRGILTEETGAKEILQNDIYSTHELRPPPRLNGIKSTMIYPATAKHITKYDAQDVFLVSETPEDYQNIILPYLSKGSFSKQWVYNILEKKTESERIVFEDDDKENGFILLPDMKWDGNLVENLYLVAIVHRHGVKSLRDLTTEHLPLLNNILVKGTEAIRKKYGLGASKLRIYIHYHPSYYHFHVHFTHLRYEAPGSGVEKAHLLSDVIDNITLNGDFYQKKTLSYIVRENEGLCKRFQEVGKL